MLFFAALGATWMLVPAAGLWVWLLVALAANGILMIGVDRVLTRI